MQCMPYPAVPSPHYCGANGCYADVEADAGADSCTNDAHANRCADTATKA